jgi:hypothetical protein
MHSSKFGNEHVNIMKHAIVEDCKEDMFCSQFTVARTCMISYDAVVEINLTEARSSQYWPPT